MPTDIIDHPAFVLFSRQALHDAARCEADLRAALDRIAIEIGLAKVPLASFDEAERFFRALFPFHALDSGLDRAARDAAIKAEIKKAFTMTK